MCDVYDDGGRLYLVALCAGIAWSQVGIVLDEAEAADFRGRPESADDIARQMCFDFTPFKDRAVPENVQQEIIAADKP
jgi:hypothetical protein